MFRAQYAHHQEVNDANCTYAASGCTRICVFDVLMMSELRSKHVEEFNFM